MFSVFIRTEKDFSLTIYRGADKSLGRPGRKQANVSVRMAWISFGALPCRKKKLDDSSRLDVVEITRVPDMLPSLFPFLPGRAKDLPALRYKDIFVLNSLQLSVNTYLLL